MPCKFRSDAQRKAVMASLKGTRLNVKERTIVAKGYQQLHDQKQEYNRQMSMGIKVEHEHTKDYWLAKKIATDHLNEDPNYYTKLKKCKL
jgi:hypothetical protein